jgi:hypothetical protein
MAVSLDEHVERTVTRRRITSVLSTVAPTSRGTELVQALAERMVRVLVQNFPCDRHEMALCRVRVAYQYHDAHEFAAVREPFGRNRAT